MVLSWKSPKELAVSISTDERTVRRWVEAGTVFAERTPGGQIRIAVDEYGWPLAPAEE